MFNSIFNIDNHRYLDYFLNEYFLYSLYWFFYVNILLFLYKDRFLDLLDNFNWFLDDCRLYSELYLLDWSINKYWLLFLYEYRPLDLFDNLNIFLNKYLLLFLNKVRLFNLNHTLFYDLFLDDNLLLHFNDSIDEIWNLY